ncbi:methyltransferase domain-containing protein [Pseudoxanthomonas japonensis]|nr:methyltransferase domain-containing protein [Pseudoxanthomonas japonensis]
MRHWTADAALRAPDQWRRRGDVLDRLEASGFQAEAGLSRQTGALREELEAIHRDFCAMLRGAIRQGRGAEALTALTAGEGDAPDGDGYDALDALLAEVLAPDAPSTDIGGLLPDMVFYQPTPARHLLALLRRLDLRESDVLIDLGSGLGHLPLLTAILTPAQAVGIEIEPAYVASARRSADALALEHVRFVAGDARTADLSAASVYYLYSPFSGAMLAGMLAILERQARMRPLRIATLGPCTIETATAAWLRTGDAIRPDAPVLFHSR